MNGPLVTVVVPTCNRQRFVSGAIESILGQTLQDFELLIVDDASRDGSAELLSAYERSDHRIRVLRTTVNSGCNVARNLGLDHARGRYVALLDDDDIALPGRLEATVAKLEAEPDLGVACSRYRFIDANGVERGWPCGELALGESPMDGASVFELLYCDWAWIPTSTLTLRTGLTARHRYPQIRRSDGDSIFHSKMAASGISFARLDEPLALVRRDNAHECMSRDHLKLFAARRESLHFLRAWLAREGITRFDHLHEVSWSNHLAKEQEHFRKRKRAREGRRHALGRIVRKLLGRRRRRG